jgi:hypothetical protein
MKPDKPTENWTKYPNNILDNMSIFSPYEFKAISLMIRKNIGYEDPNYEFSASYISQKCPMSIAQAKRSLRGLRQKDVIKIVGKGKRGVLKYTINWNTDLSDWYLTDTSTGS